MLGLLFNLQHKLNTSLQSRKYRASTQRINYKKENKNKKSNQGSIEEFELPQTDKARKLLIWPDTKKTREMFVVESLECMYLRGVWCHPVFLVYWFKQKSRDCKVQLTYNRMSTLNPKIYFALNTLILWIIEVNHSLPSQMLLLFILL